MKYTSHDAITWTNKVFAEYTEEEIAFVKDPSSDKEAVKNLVRSKSNAVDADPSVATKLSEIYNDNKPAIKEGDDYSLTIIEVVFIKDFLSFNMAYRLNGLHHNKEVLLPNTLES